MAHIESKQEESPSFQKVQNSVKLAGIFIKLTLCPVLKIQIAYFTGYIQYLSLISNLAEFQEYICCPDKKTDLLTL